MKEKKFSKHYSWLGPILYISSIQYFIVQYIVALRFSPAYSLANNTISDLGNSSCNVFKDRLVCSPLHLLMDVSFIILGLVMILGSRFVYDKFRGIQRARLCFSLFSIGGFGVILVGLFPENTISILHDIGATLPFLVGNLAILIFGFSNRLNKIISFYTIITGLVALIAFGIYASGHFLGLGEGGLERIVAYPQTIWMIVIGLSLILGSKTKIINADNIFLF